MTSGTEKHGLSPPDWVMAMLLAGGIIVAFQPVWHAGFIWDDDAYVTENKLLSAPDGLRRIWFSRDLPSQYFPLVYTLFWGEHKLWDFNPAGYHWVNLLLHAINGLLLWRVLKRLDIPGAWLAAALFALHPVQVETVAWVTEGKNVLSLCVYLLAVRAWVEFVWGREEIPLTPALFPSDGARGNRRLSLCSLAVSYCLSLFCFLLALLSKTTACTLPVVLLLILWLKREPINRRRLIQLAPFFGVGLIMGLATIWWERHHIGTSGPAFAMGWLERILVAGRAIWFYAAKLIWPANLAFSYPRWVISPADFIWVFLGLLCCAAIYFARRYSGRSIETAALFYAVTLAPTLGFIMLYTFRYTFVADHYQYVACIGPFALVAAGVSGLSWSGLTGRTARVSLSAILLLVLAVLSWRQSQAYQDSESLWRATLAANPGSFLAHYQLANAVLKKGKFEEAIAEYQKYLQIQPGDADGHYNLANIFMGKGQIDEAIVQYQKTLEIHPRDAEAHNNLGAALMRRGLIDEAIGHFQQALAIRPGFAKASSNLNQAIFLKNQNPKAEDRKKPDP